MNDKKSVFLHFISCIILHHFAPRYNYFFYFFGCYKKESGEMLPLEHFPREC